MGKKEDSTTSRKLVLLMATRRLVRLREFAQEGAEEFSDNHWIQLIQQGSSTTRIEYCLDNKISFMISKSDSGTLWWYSNKTGIDVVHDYSL